MEVERVNGGWEGKMEVERVNKWWERKLGEI